VLLLRIVYYLFHYRDGYWDVEDDNNTASVSIKFNVIQYEHCTLSLINTDS